MENDIAYELAGKDIWAADVMNNDIVMSMTSNRTV